MVRRPKQLMLPQALAQWLSREARHNESNAPAFAGRWILLSSECRQRPKLNETLHNHSNESATPATLFAYRPPTSGVTPPKRISECVSSLFLSVRQVTMVYTPVLNRGWRGVRSPLDSIA